MFTGIIKELGIIKKITNKKKATTFEVQTKKILKGKKIGDSIAVNGICVTITKISKQNFHFDAIPETIALTNLKNIKPNTELNLEPALTLSQSIDGHLVQGHIDTTGTVKSLSQTKNRVILTIAFPQEIAKYLAFKGSITINGVSLTISDLQQQTFSVDLIPHTLKITNLGKFKKKDKVNLEVDLLARYLKRLLDDKESQTKYEFLKDRNLI